MVLLVSVVGWLVCCFCMGHEFVANRLFIFMIHLYWESISFKIVFGIVCAL